MSRSIQGVLRRRFLKQFVVLSAIACFMTPAFGDETVLLESKEAKVTNLDFEAEIARIPEENRAEVLNSRDRIRKLLENLLISKTLAARARSAGIDQDPAVVKQMDLASEKVLAQEQINRAIQELKYPDFEVRANELYRLDIDKYTLPEKVHVSHILVDTKDRTPEEALKRIQEVRALAIGGKAFADLALEYSDDKSAKTNKGDLGFFEAGRMTKPFADKAFEMSTPGEISEPVKTEFGYHIIQFHEKQPRRIRPFDEVKDGILNNLRDKYSAEYRQKMISDIVTDPALKLNVDAVEKYKTSLTMPSGNEAAAHMGKSPVMMKPSPEFQRKRPR